MRFLKMYEIKCSIRYLFFSLTNTGDCISVRYPPKRPFEVTVDPPIVAMPTKDLGLSAASCGIILRAISVLMLLNTV